MTALQDQPLQLPTFLPVFIRSMRITATNALLFLVATKAGEAHLRFGCEENLLLPNDFNEAIDYLHRYEME